MQYRARQRGINGREWAFGLGGRVFDEPFHLHSSVKQDAFKKLLNKSPAMLRCSHGHNVPSHLIPVETKKRPRFSHGQKGLILKGSYTYNKYLILILTINIEYLLNLNIFKSVLVNTGHLFCVCYCISQISRFDSSLWLDPILILIQSDMLLIHLDIHHVQYMSFS